MTEAWMPPSFSYRTFVAFFAEFAGGGPVPPRVDLSVVEAYPPSVGPQLLALLTQMGLVDADGAVVPARMAEVVRGEAARRAFLRRWAREVYAEQLRLVADGADAPALEASFAAFGYKPHKIPRAAQFFQALSADLRLPEPR
ncbi:hypothetical protein LO762_11360 [Actinocorallia sp. API 0066]|uniref:hypothetical protein n=1 Tax=Actinocorallia sp. API 0066 TaxID=2896846 RepID=UPI001E5A4C88|nr:hypothetical protein [Actinocorallia sp. API 0066]MCD0449782.1 hypothetical protein [Actinocorallia sp. API 0066]